MRGRPKFKRLMDLADPMIPISHRSISKFSVIEGRSHDLNHLSNSKSNSLPKSIYRQQSQVSICNTIFYRMLPSERRQSAPRAVRIDSSEDRFPEIPNVGSPGRMTTGTATSTSSISDNGDEEDEIIPPSHAHRTLVLCFDGTGQSRFCGGRVVRSLTGESFRRRPVRRRCRCFVWPCGIASLMAFCAAELECSQSLRYVEER